MTDLPKDDFEAMLASPVTPVGERKQPPASYGFTESCPKCNGTGKFVSYSGRILGDCFACKGAGKNQFKTSPQARAKARDNSANRAAKALADNVEGFMRDYPAIHAWLLRNPSEFSTSLLGGVAKFGSLTEKQLAAVERNIERDAARVAERAAREASAPVVSNEGVDRLKAAFDKAAAYTAAKATGLTRRKPKLTIGGITISPAGAQSSNAGGLYCYGPGAVYLGKITDGKLHANYACTDEQQAQILKFVESPADAAKVYGQETGVCCVCNATLRSEWRLRGIGPICAEKFGW